MRLSFRFFLSLAATAAMLVVVPALLSPGTPDATPYASALADLGVGPAFAAGCGSKTCQFVHGRIACARSSDNSNCKAGSGFCESKPCIP